MNDKKTPNNPRVFPHVGIGGLEHYGLTLRDYLAGQALAGILAANKDCAYAWAAEEAYTYADAALKARGE